MKMNVLCPVEWKHHHRGWKACYQALRDNFHDPNGVPFYTNGTIGFLEEGIILPYPWICFLHITSSDRIKESYLTNKNWQDSFDNCLGVFVLSEYSRIYLQSFLRIKVEKVFYPMDKGIEFDINKFQDSIVSIGHWKRDISKFSSLKTTWKKKFLRCKEEIPNGVEIIDYLDEQGYDELLSNHSIFLNLTDSSANTTVLECISRNTPLFVNRLPALEEYLGRNYPLFYEDINKIDFSYEALNKGYLYLKQMDKSKFEMDYFIKSVRESKIVSILNSLYL